MKLIRYIKKLKYSAAAVLLNSTTIYLLIMLAKLGYFGAQVGAGSISPVQIFVSLGSLLLLSSLSMLLKPKAALWYMGLLNILVTAIIFSNVIFYRYFNDLISVPLLFQAGNLGDVQNSLLELLRWSDLLLAADILLVPFILQVLKNCGGNRESLRNKLTGTIACLAMGVLIVIVGFSQLVRSQPAILETFYDRVYVAQNVGLLNYHAADFYTYVQQNLQDDNQLNEDKKQEILDYFLAHKQQANKIGQLKAAGKGKNLLVIQAEALQQFVINASVNGKEITPNLNKLASAGIYFNNYYYQTAGGGTSDAEFTSLVSMFPMKEGSVYIRKPGNRYFTLPLKLKAEGYETVAMHGYKPGFWNRSVVYNNIGFDKFFSMNEMDQSERLGMGISDKSFFKQAMNELKNKQQPYFAFLITLSNHFPYDNDKTQYSSFDVGEYKGTLFGDYLEAVHYADEALGEFVAELQNRGMLDNTVLVVYGDHHGIPRDNKAELAKFLGKEDLSAFEWQQLQKVPMIISGQGLGSRLVETVGGGVDLMPTLLNILDIDGGNQPSFGQDLINADKGMVVLRNGSFVTDELLYISSENKGYDIRTGKEVSAEGIAEWKQQADTMLDYSDTILQYDLSDEIYEYLDK